MTVSIYIWQPHYNKSSLFSAFNFRYVGHVSMQINNTYISHRPAQDCDMVDKQEYFIQASLLVFLFYLVFQHHNFVRFLKKYFRSGINDNTLMYVKLKEVNSINSKNYTFEDELKDRKGQKYKRIKVWGLNEEKMLDYYSSLSSRDLKYHPFNKNCCTFIAKIVLSSLDCSKPCHFCEFKDIGENFKENSQAFSQRAKSIFYKSDFIGIRLLKLYVLTLRYFPMMLLFHLIHIGGHVWTPNKIERFIKILNSQTTSQKTCLKN